MNTYYYKLFENAKRFKRGYDGRFYDFYYEEGVSAVADFNGAGQVSCILFFKDARYYRADGPAVIYFNQNGEVVYFKYYK